jgi:S-adenosyl methyltransferase
MGGISEDSAVVPVGVNFTKPSIARVYDALIGGKDNFAVDRAMAQEMIDKVPHAQDAALLNRAALVRAVHFLVTSAGIDQFIDLGSGLPTQENVHQIAQRHCPGAHIVYVDNDPMVLAHGRALLATDDTTRVISADFREPDKVLGDPGLLELIDFSRPIGMIMCGILHHIRDDENPKKLVADYSDRLAAGSYLFITQLCRTGGAGDAALKKISSKHRFAGAYRTLQEIGEFFAGWELIDPGVTFLPLWVPAGPRRSPAMLKEFEQLHAGGLGRKNPRG